MRPLALLAIVLTPLFPLSVSQPDRALRTEVLQQPQEFTTVELRGWTVHVDAQLAEQDELKTEVLALLGAKLREVDSRLPPAVVGRLRQVHFYMRFDREGCAGGVYHPSARWLKDHDLDPAMAGGIEFGNAHNFLTWVHTQPSFVLHELAHAWHHQVLGYDHVGLIAAYASAQTRGDYEQVLYVRGGSQRAYAMNNVQEYFAEASEAWWGTNDYYPFVRAELMEHDPHCVQLLEEVWNPAVLTGD